METSHLRQHLHLHFIVVLLGFTAILGALISMPAADLVWYRMFFATAGLWVFFLIKKLPYRLPFEKQLPLYLIGTLVALHWITFFHAIKVSNVSVTLGVFASVPLFTSFLEPLLQRRRILWLEVLIGMIILLGIYLIFRYEFYYMQGILYALLSALLNGLFVVLNRNISMRHHPTVISFYEMIGGFLLISLYFLITGAFSEELFRVTSADLGYLLILGLLCTSYAFAAIVHIMKVLTAYNVVLAVSMEPVYGIALAYMIFRDAERMSGGFYIGTLIIMVAVFLYPYLKYRLARRKVKSEK